MIINSHHRRGLAASKRRELFGHMLAIAGGDDRIRALAQAIVTAERISAIECVAPTCPSCWRAIVRNTEAEDTP